MNKEYPIDVALSFAGEDRDYVDKVATMLQNKDIQVFYDKFEEAELWGKNLYTYLDNIYRNSAKYCVIFISEHYARKLWTNHERESAQARAFQENQEFILPVRLDDTQIPGILPTVYYVDGNKISPAGLVELIIKKLNKTEKNKAVETVREDDYNIPRVKRKINDLERKQYLNNSFNVIRDYFEKALSKIKLSNPHVESEFKGISENKFVSELYVEGNLKVQCKIWIGDMFGSNNSISYAESTRGLDYNNDNSFNDSATVEDDGKDIYFRILGMSFGNIKDLNINLARASEKEVAKYFWGRYIQALNY
jgi:hypothetical protein